MAVSEYNSTAVRVTCSTYRLAFPLVWHLFDFIKIKPKSASTRRHATSNWNALPACLALNACMCLNDPCAPSPRIRGLPCQLFPFFLFLTKKETVVTLGAAVVSRWPLLHHRTLFVAKCIVLVHDESSILCFLLFAQLKAVLPGAARKRCRRPRQPLPRRPPRPRSFHAVHPAHEQPGLPRPPCARRRPRPR